MNSRPVLSNKVHTTTRDDWLRPKGLLDTGWEHPSFTWVFTRLQWLATESIISSLYKFRHQFTSIANPPHGIVQAAAVDFAATAGFLSQLAHLHSVQAHCPGVSQFLQRFLHLEIVKGVGRNRAG